MPKYIKAVTPSGKWIVKRLREHTERKLKEKGCRIIRIVEEKKKSDV